MAEKKRKERKRKAEKRKKKKNFIGWGEHDDYIQSFRQSR
jgi:hypothetical protein